MLAISAFNLPNVGSLKWVAGKFKLKPIEMLGLYAIMHGPTGKHYDALIAITKELMKRIKLDPSPANLAKFGNLIVWATSMDK